jgi:YfiR/HmsC-like
MTRMWKILRSPRGVLTLLMIGALSWWSGVALSAEAYREDVVKAAFLYRFTGYVEWPSQALQDDYFTIAVMGGESVADELGKLVTQHSVRNLPIRVRSIAAAKQALDAQVLYIGSHYTGDVRALIQSLATTPILIVTDNPRGLDNGATLNFMLVDRRVRFEVSLPSANRAGIKVSSELLAVAVRVRGSSLLSDPVCMPQLEDFAGWVLCEHRVAAL